LTHNTPRNDTVYPNLCCANVGGQNPYDDHSVPLRCSFVPCQFISCVRANGVDIAVVKSAYGVIPNPSHRNMIASDECFFSPTLSPMPLAFLRGLAHHQPTPRSRRDLRYSSPTHILSASEHSSSPRSQNVNVHAAAAFGTYPIETQPPLFLVGVSVMGSCSLLLGVQKSGSVGRGAMGRATSEVTYQYEYYHHARTQFRSRSSETRRWLVICGAALRHPPPTC